MFVIHAEAVVQLEADAQAFIDTLLPPFLDKSGYKLPEQCFAFEQADAQPAAAQGK